MKSAENRGWLSALPAALLLVASCLVGCLEGHPRHADTTQKNLVVVVSDTLRAANLTAYGYPRATSPRLDRLAAESVIFENHLANYPGTPISVSQMMSGRVSPPLLMSSGAAIPSLRQVESDLLVLPRILQESGRTTGLVSSHPWFDEEARILQFFDEQHVVPSADRLPYAPMESLLPPARSFLERRAADRQPFFLYLHSMDTHMPYRPHQGVPFFDDWGLVDRYDHEILYTDLWTGRLLDALEEFGLADDTVFVFTSDHGEDLGEMGPEWWNLAHGNTLRRSQLHVPMIVRAPGVEPARLQTLTRHVDLAPTLLGLLLPNLPLDGYRLDGTDLSDSMHTGEGMEGLESVAFTWRYWTLVTQERQTLYDQWRDEVRSVRWQPDERNYPRPIEVASEDPDESTRLRGEIQELVERHTAETAALAPLEEISGSTGIPTEVVHGRSSRPTYDDSEEDDHWFLKTWMLLQVGAAETPAPLQVGTPWVRGSYRIYLRLHASGPARGLANRFLIEIIEGGRGAIQVDGSMADARGFVDLGIHKVGTRFEVRFSDVEGGMSASGFYFRGVGEDLPPEVDPEEEEQLRALGYLE